MVHNNIESSNAIETWVRWWLESTFVPQQQRDPMGSHPAKNAKKEILSGNFNNQWNFKIKNSGTPTLTNAPVYNIGFSEPGE